MDLISFSFDASAWIGSIGVTLLLLAFGLHLFGGLSRESRIYSLMNVLGAGLSCYASILIHYMPFVVLEGAWCLVALIGLFRKKRGGQGAGSGRLNV